MQEIRLSHVDHWEQRVANSQAIREAREVATLISDLKQRKTGSEEQAYLDRIDFVVGLVVSRLEDYDPRLIPEGVLNSLAGSLVNLHNYLNSWAQGQPLEYLSTHSQSMVDSVLGTLATIPQQDVAVAKEAVASLKRSVSSYRSALDKETELIADKLRASSQAVTGLEQKAASIEADLDHVKVASQTQATNLQSAFSKSETERAETFSQLLADKAKELNGTVEDLTRETKKSAQLLTAEIRKDQDEAKKARGKIEEILGIVSEQALIADYTNSANRDRDSASNWRIGTVVSILVAIAFTAWLTGIFNGGPGTWQELVTKSVLALSFGALATYAARQSSEHRKAQRNAERMALQLAALKPYLQDLDDKPMRDKLLADVAGRLFGQKQEEEKVQQFRSSKDDPTIVGQLAAALVELVKSNTKNP